LTAYFYEIQTNIFIGIINYKLAEDILTYLKKEISGKGQVIFIKENKNIIEGFDIYYINCPEQFTDFDGIKFFK